MVSMNENCLTGWGLNLQPLRWGSKMSTKYIQACSVVNFNHPKKHLPAYGVAMAGGVKVKVWEPNQFVRVSWKGVDFLNEIIPFYLEGRTVELTKLGRKYFCEKYTSNNPSNFKFQDWVVPKIEEGMMIDAVLYERLAKDSSFYVKKAVIEAINKDSVVICPPDRVAKKFGKKVLIHFNSIANLLTPKFKVADPEELFPGLRVVVKDYFQGEMFYTGKILKVGEKRVKILFDDDREYYWVPKSNVGIKKG